LRATFDPAAVLADLTRRPITRIAVVPTMLRALLPLVESDRARPFAGTVMAGGEPLPSALGRRIRAAWPDVRLWDIYGLTETGTCDFFLPADEYDDGAGSIGRPGPGIDYRLSEPDGELQIRTPTAMLGYLDQPELTTAAFADGWLRTGDLARRRDDGRVELIGRAKELILRAGNKISPLEVERVFADHPGIAGVLATGAADALRGEAIHLFVVPRPDVALDAASLLDWARDRLERYKLPDQIHFGSELPLGRTGKADRGALRKLVEQSR
jgi:long-chain acyl-CoA synthetase